MRACEFHTILVLHLLFALATTRYEEPAITSITKLELTPVHIECRLTDIVVITAPIINNKALYYLSNPHGNVKQLNINLNLNETHDLSEFKDQRVLDWISLVRKGYFVFNVNRKSDVNFEDIHSLMKENDFVIGPVNENDHGNWVLSVYSKDWNEEWIEFFQIITLEIREYVPANQNTLSLRSGESFLPSFAFPIKSIESCELIVPNNNSDRYYAKDPTKPEWCGFIVNRVTDADQGVWSIIAVGKIVYLTIIYLEVDEDT